MDSNPPQSPAQKLENWLRYYHDLGITSFFHDRQVMIPKIAPPVHIEPAIEAAEVQAPAQTKENILKPASNQSVPSGAPAAPVFSGGGSSSQISAMAQAPSLFRVVDKVAGDSLERISSDLGECTRCKLHRHRNKIVFGSGNPHAELMFVGEGPGHDEDIQGLPFVGRAGKLLTQMIEAMGLSRSEVYIANVVKCRPPENRTPEKDEVSTCMPFLLRQVAAIQPKAIVCLGNCAAQALLNTNKSISRFRGEWCDFHGSRLIATYHPAYLLRNPHAKPDVWNDLKKVMKYLGLTPLVKGKSRT